LRNAVWGWLLGVVAAPAAVAVGAAAGDSPQLRIQIVHPPEKMSLPALERTFVFGSVHPPDARVTVHGLDSPIVRSSLGGWLAVIPLTAGKMTIVAAARLEDGTETQVARKVTVNGAPGNAAKPAGNVGDWAVHKPPEERVWKPHRIGRIAADTAYLRSGPDRGDEQAGFELPLQKNVLVTVVGQIDKSLHVRLSALESVWVEAHTVKLLPKQTPSPQSFVNGWTVRRNTRSTLLQTGLEELLPYRVTVAPDGRSMSLKIYGGISNTDWLHYASDDPWIRLARWSQPMEGVYQLDLELRRPLWGYDVRYEGLRLILELRDPPASPPPERPTSMSDGGRGRRTSVPPPAPPPPNYLAGVRVCLDPGHPPLGATGPMGTTEHAANWRMAVSLRDVLVSNGADVVMTRQDGETLALPDRVLRARQASADLFVSIHANALPPADNPFEKNGFSVYYFQPFSQPLAEAVHAAMRASIPLRDDGLHYANFHVTRQSYMPAILIECAYLMWPPEEALILDPDFRDRAAWAIADGIKTFLSERDEEE